MVLGYLMIGLGLGIATPTAYDMGKTVFEFAKNKRTKKKVPLEQTVELTKGYLQLFENMGLIDTKKGDWVTCLGIDHKKYCSIIRFKLSDTLSIKKFITEKESIMQKLQYNAKPIENIDIYDEKGLMCFLVRFGDIPAEPYKFIKTAKSIIPLGIGLNGEVVSWDMKKDPHMMLIGTSGSGKSTLLNAVINHIYHNSPKSPLYLIDLKCGLEFGIYKNTKNVVAYAQDVENAKQVIAEFEAEADRRYEILAEAGYRNYNKYIDDKPASNLQRAYLIIDEFADLMSLNNKKTEYDAIEALVSLSRKVRAVGMHIIISSQRAVAECIPPTLKANVQCILGMKTVNEHNSRLIIDEPGLEKLNVGECVGIISSQKQFFKAYYMTDDIIEATVKQFRKEDKEPTKATNEDKKQKLLK